MSSVVSQGHGPGPPVVGVPPSPERRDAESPRIGEMLIQNGLISSEHLEVALNLQRETGRRIGETLVEMGAVAPMALTRVLAQRLGYEFVDFSVSPLDMLVARRIPEDIARRYQALPIAETDGRILVAMVNPEDVFALDDLRALTNAPVVAVMAEAAQLFDAIERAFAGGDLASTVDEAVNDAEANQKETPIVDALSEAPIIRLVNALIDQAIDQRASDVHIEPSSTRVRFRSRIDGVLRDTSEVPTAVLRPLVSRLKLMAGIDITRTRVPNDGRFSVKVRDRTVDVRVATLPTARGEAVSLRLLDQSRGVIRLDQLGFLPDELDRYRNALSAPQGTILVTGPTGSGKTSTLYATLLELNTDDRSTVTVEDPVEYQIDGVRQIQVDRQAGLTFPIALRAILRSDPDIVLVGEIRDGETAKIASEAALTGHMVLSTLHATGAAATPLRLIEMGLEPYLVTSAVTCIVAQRLARRLCQFCAETDPGAPRLLRELGASDELIETGTLKKPVGCPHCSGTGYRGRTAIYETMPLTEPVARLVLKNASSAEIERQAVAEGMDTLRVSAMRRVAAGEFGISEMLRAVTVEAVDPGDPVSP